MSRFETSLEHLSKVLNDIRDVDEAGFEIVPYIEIVIKVIEAAAAKETKLKPSDHLEPITEKYLGLISSLVGSQKIARNLTQPVLRGRIDHLNVQLWNEIETIYSKYNAKIEIDPLVCLQDKAKKAWKKNFGSVPYVKFSRLFDSLVTKSDSLKEQKQKALQYLLDNSYTGYVSTWKFGDFLSAFGPLEECTSNARVTFNSPWFHGYLSPGEAEILLSGSPQGTFMVRLGQSRPSMLRIACKSVGDKYKHTQIDCSPLGLTVEENCFKSTVEIVKFYAYECKLPYLSYLSGVNLLFWEDMTSAEAEEFLKNKKPSTFLMRLSSKTGYIASTCVENNGDFGHYLFNVLPDGFQGVGSDDNPIFKSFDTMIGPSNLKYILSRENPKSYLMYDPVPEKVTYSNDYVAYSGGPLVVREKRALSYVITDGSGDPSLRYSEFDSTSLQESLSDTSSSSAVALPQPSVIQPKPVFAPSNYGSLPVFTRPDDSALPPVSSKPLSNPAPLTYGSLPLSLSPTNRTLPQNYGSIPSMLPKKNP